MQKPDTDVAYGKQLVAQGRPDEGEQYLRDLLARREAGLPAGDPRIHGARLAHGGALLALGRPEEALAVISAAAAEAERAHGVRHQATLSARTQVVDALIATGRLADAERQTRALIDEYEAPWFRQAGFAAERCWVRTQLVKVLGQAGRVREAVDVSDRMLPEVAELLGPHHPYALICRINRTQQLALMGRFAEAEAEGVALSALAADLAGRRDPNAAIAGLAAANNLAFSYAESGRPADAERHARGPLTEAERMFGPYSDFAQALRLNLATALVGQGRYEEARGVAEALPGYSDVQPGGRSLAVAEALYGLRMLPEAEAAALHALNEAGARLAPIHHRILRTRTLLALIRDSPEEMRAAAAAWTEHFGPDHPRTRAARAALEPLG
ncbi:tetratricopeptide repeat protein [Actinacidiphila acididurans]|uniref:Tetratricopeptide repeat protein n=1 Tax=Actinacidiphila acididurans TaxID=2784346 RepID=A0ABS2TWR5_9ACTN|nr:tetratricopeptide repeat protein [Actinacidiphila acididurans]MBM9507786.1 tetratricopeptide repeat protein [Actinacidiphila acididurans]